MWPKTIPNVPFRSLCCVLPSWDDEKPFSCKGHIYQMQCMCKGGDGEAVDMKYSLYESAPSTSPKGGWLLTQCIVSCFSWWGSAVGGSMAKRGNTEQTVASTWSWCGRVGGFQLSHVVLSNHQLIPRRKWKDNTHWSPSAIPGHFIPYG